ncbi:ion transporter [Alkalihalophilus pseudofirmus]|uniref:potassium channel family protein n=1 Tax=Alkalihalobacterium alkalinitrilicum TaxID=427920 RepID=UPI00094DA59A|nr:potassium channel family protein [Alkalihalobacterium alkalinitrilicum]OLO28233.1 ion transporter [Alkalihalophilus pseudofirmus]
MGELLILTVISIAVLGVLMSILLLLKNRPLRGQALSLRNFVVLFTVYITITVGFGLLYMALEMAGFTVLTEGKRHVGGSVLHLLEDTMYFSAVTLLSVGYGDIAPLGFGRPIAMVQALIGYVLPAAFVVTTVVYMDKRSE